MNWALVGAIFGAIGVAAGAFGAHGLKGHVSAERLEVFETAVRYQLLHVFALFAAHTLDSPSAGWAFATGIAIFSGSLYLLVLLDRSWLGAVTPLGGLLLIAGWVFLALAARR